MFSLSLFLFQFEIERRIARNLHLWYISCIERKLLLVFHFRIDDVAISKLSYQNICKNQLGTHRYYFSGLVAVPGTAHLPFYPTQYVVKLTPHKVRSYVCARKKFTPALVETYIVNSNSRSSYHLAIRAILSNFWALSYFLSCFYLRALWGTSNFSALKLPIFSMTARITVICIGWYNKHKTHENDCNNTQHQ